VTLASPTTPQAIFAQATDRAQGKHAKALRISVANALPAESRDRGAEIFRRVSSALHQASAENGLFTSPEAVVRVFELMSELPARIPLPQVVVESDTEMGLDWDEGNQKVLSLTVRNTPLVGYSALLGAEPLYGRAPFAGEIPQTIWFLLRRLYPEHRSQRC
jgi:hypothetical protein